MTWRIIASRGTEQVLAQDSAPDACFLQLGSAMAGPFPRAVIFGTGYFTAMEQPVQVVNVPKDTITAQQYLTAVEQVAVGDDTMDDNETGDREPVPDGATGTITKIDKAQQVVYGFASIIDKGDGVPIEDAQGDVILEDDLVEAAHGFMRNHRTLGHRHQQVEGIGDIVESLVITKDVRTALGLPATSPLGWFIGCKVTDPEVWSRVESGELRAFSIGGSGEREQMATAVTPLRKMLLAKIAARADVNPDAGTAKYGKVKFADRKNKKYPIDTPEHVRAAWSYIHQGANAAKYSAKDAAAITRTIARAAKRFGIALTDSPLEKAWTDKARAAALLARRQMRRARVDSDPLAHYGYGERVDQRLANHLKTLRSEKGKSRELAAARLSARRASRYINHGSYASATHHLNVSEVFLNAHRKR